MANKTIRCPNCATPLTVQVIHGGFSSLIPFTCPEDSTVTTVFIYDRTIDDILGGYPTTAWNEEQYRKVEARLKPCPCGGRFRRDVVPKCSACGKDLRVKLPSGEFLVVGKLIEGDRESPWLSVQKSRPATSLAGPTRRST